MIHLRIFNKRIILLEEKDLVELSASPLIDHDTLLQLRDLIDQNRKSLAEKMENLFISRRLAGQD